jgi:hypothetical protein
MGHARPGMGSNPLGRSSNVLGSGLFRNTNGNVPALGNGELLGALLGNGSSNAQNWGPLAQQWMNGNGNGYGYGQHYEDPYAKAYRDAAIANAVVSALGILATTSQQMQYQRQQQYLPQQQYAPAPQPAQRIEHVKTLVSPARYEQYQEWIPPLYDSRTGAQIGGGFNETRTRLMPEVYEYRDIVVGPGQ